MLLSRCTTPPLVLLSSVAVLVLFGFLNNAFSLWRVSLPASTIVDEWDSQACNISNNQANATRVLKEHRYRRDGLLEVNVEGPHPIYQLTARAEAAWRKKLQGASKTLPEAVREYRRRYGRAPPLGFDSWWNYVTEHNVQLPDEYDSIFHDLEPFWGIEPRDLLMIRDELESKRDSYTIGRINGTTIGVVNYAFKDGDYDRLIKSSYNVINILREVEEHLPSFRAVLSPHDAPNLLSDYGVKAAALEAARTQSYIKRGALPKINNIGWVSACPPSSPARHTPIDLDAPPPRSSKKTFIHDHQLSMDPCLHPELFYHHGQFLSYPFGPAPQREMIPGFSFCATTLHHNIRMPHSYGWLEDILPRTDDPEWDDKLDERLVWRGSNTGMWHAANTRWRASHRDFTVSFANELNGTTRVLFPTESEKEQVGEPREMRNARMNPAMLDVAFAGKPLGCEEKTCELLERVFTWKQRQSVREAGNYKYVLDIDGNGWSGRFKRLITSNALVFKATIYPEWFMDRIAPWVHYVPVQLDMSDLHDALIFFRGDGNGEKAHEDMARKIAVAGRQWSKEFWRTEDLVAFWFRLMLEYARLTSLDRRAMSFVLEGSD